MKKPLSAGDKVYFDGFSASGSSPYTITRVMPMENDDRRRYRIKSASELFERVANEDQLTRV